MNDKRRDNLLAVGYYVYLITAIIVLYYTYRLDRLQVDVKVTSDQRRHVESDKFIKDFKP